MEHENEINLNKGQKWQVNEEMKPHIETAEIFLNDFVSNEKEDYHQLAENLSIHNKTLIKSCTMKGESHDELHKWLHPHMELIDKLEKASNLTEANDIISELQKSFETYHRYFE